MLMAEAGYMFMGCILLISGTQGQQRSVCALEGSTVRLPCSGQHPTSSGKWYTVDTQGSGVVQHELTANSAASTMSEDGNLTLTINHLSSKDAKLYCCGENPQKCSQNAVNLQVTDLIVKFTPSAEVTEGQKVTVICKTSCPLTDNINYFWRLNNQSLKNQNKHLFLDRVSGQDAGNYSCSVKFSNGYIMSSNMTLTVFSTTRIHILAAGALVIIPVAVVLWIRKKKTPSQSSRAETSDSVEQMNCGPIIENTSAEPTEQDDHQYTSLIFSTNHTEDLYSTINPSNYKICHNFQRPLS